MKRHTRLAPQPSRAASSIARARHSLQRIALLSFLAVVLGGCTKVVVPDHIDVGGVDYVAGPPTAAAWTDPDGTPHVTDPVLLAQQQDQWTREHTHYVPMWGCTAFDAGTTVIALAHGLAEANPLGLLAIPFSVAVNFAAQHRADRGDAAPARMQAVAHCGAGTLNVATLAGAL